MSIKNSLELQGSLSANPAAELITEITSAGLMGSLRLAHGQYKAILYFESGKLVYAVSNSRAFRLSDALISKGLINKGFFVENPTVTTDMQISEKLVATGKITVDEMNSMVVSQCESIIVSVLDWKDGEWTYSPHSRVKAGVAYDIDAHRLLFEYSRGVSAETASRRFPSIKERFELKTHPDNGFQLQPHEAFVLSRFDSGHINLDQLIAVSGLPPEVSRHVVYCLWLGGFLKRQGSLNAAISDKRISEILSTTLELKKSARAPLVRPIPKPKPLTSEPEFDDEPADTTEFDLLKEIERIEAASDYYQVLGVEAAAKIPALRKAYFRLAKQLHPDRHHKESAEVLRRVEKAFTELAQAHETLKNHDTRSAYDVQMRQAEQAKKSGAETDGHVSKQEEQAEKDFDHGFDLQLGGNFEEAVPYLARAVYYAPLNARYHAFYGKALSADETQRHKAENELTAATRIEPKNESYRIMLAEFFIRFKLLKRAEGELNRLLAEFPGNKQARSLLDSLQLK